jgi:hypothetical protein
METQHQRVRIGRASLIVSAGILFSCAAQESATNDTGQEGTEQQELITGGAAVRPVLAPNMLRIESTATPAQFAPYQFPVTVVSNVFTGGWLIEGYYLHPSFNDYVLIDVVFFRRPTAPGRATLQQASPRDDNHAQVYAYIPNAGGLNWFSVSGEVHVVVVNGVLSVVLNNVILSNGTTSVRTSLDYAVTRVDTPIAGPSFSGGTGTTWEARASGGPRAAGLSDFTPTGLDGFLAIGSERRDGATFQRYQSSNNTWSAALAEPRRDTDGLEGTAWVGGSLYLFNRGLIEEYNIASKAWTTLARRVPFTGESNATHDDAGNVYALTPIQQHGWWQGRRSQNVIRWDIAKKEWEILSVPVRAQFDGRGDNPLLTWDATSARLYLADRDEGNLRRYDPRTETGVQDKAHPDDAVGFLCGDRHGHLYAGGDWRSPNNAKTIWQYTVTSSVWRQIPALPFAKSRSSACTVHGDGWLYVTDGRGALARLQLL